MSNSQGGIGVVSNVDDPPKSYEECLKEIQELKASEDYGNWGGQTRPNKGRELTPESFQRPPEFTEGWAKKMNGLFAAKRAESE